MRGDLSVRINDGTTDRHVTRHVSDLRFTKTAPGGHHSASMRLSLPRDTFGDLGPADKIWVYSTRTGRPLWEGFTQNPGATDGPEGQGFDLSAIGTTVLATDESRALIYVDRDLSSMWEKYNASAPSASAQPADDPNATAGDGLLCQFNPGQPIDTSDGAQIGYNGFTRSDMEYGASVVTFKSGKADADYSDYVAWSGASSGSGIIAAAIGTGTTTANRFVGAGAGHPPAGSIGFAYGLQRDGAATNVADDNTWTHFYDLAVLGRRMDRFGTLLTDVTGMVSNTHVLASWVVEDILGRLLTLCDMYASTVETTTFEINQLTYLEAVNARKVLDDLAGLEPDFLWEMLHSTASGYVFNYRAWPTAARYEISTADGYNKTGGDVDLCNRIAVTYTDERGRTWVEPVAAAVPALDDLGRTRGAEPVTMSPGRGSQLNAQRYGEMVLAAKNEGPKAATARVGRPIVDYLRGTTVEPWEIEPGYLVSVRETGDLLRLTQMEYVDADGAATLQLGLPTPTVDERVAVLVSTADWRF